MPQHSYQEGKPYRFIVRSASEAIALIKKELGDRAHVVSVKQVPNSGLLGMFTSPKLEVIAMVNAKEDCSFANENGKDLSDVDFDLSDSIPAQRIKPDVLQAKRSCVGNLEDVLRKSGFSGSLLNELKCQQDWDTWASMSLGEALKSISFRWMDQFRALPRCPLAKSVAFIGSPGVGKTTALCHYLTQEVFVSGKKVGVVKLEGDLPNSDESLSAFCDIIDSPLWREPFDLSSQDVESEFYFDVPGVNVFDANSWASWGGRLNKLAIESRVLVLNAAYEAAILSEITKQALGAGATHVVFTHMDELHDASKLWPLVLRSGLSPLFLSDSRTIVGKRSDAFLNALLTKTFPPSLVPFN